MGLKRKHELLGKIKQTRLGGIKIKNRVAEIEKKKEKIKEIGEKYL